MVDTCAAEFAAETPYFYSTYASAGSPPEAPPVARPGALVIGSGPVRIGQGIEFDYCAVQAADVAPARGLERGDGQLQPGDGVDRLRRLDPPVLRAARPRERARASSTFESGGPSAGPTPLPAVVAFGGQTPLNLAAPLVAAGVPLLGSDLEAIDQAEERTRFAALLDRLGHPAARGRHGRVDRGGAHARRAHRLPGHRPARRSSSAGSPSTSPTRPRTSSVTSPRPRSSTPTGRCASTASSRASRSTSTPSATGTAC